MSETGQKQPKSGALSKCSRCDHCRVTRSGGGPLLPGQRTVPGRDGRKLLDDLWGTELLRPMTCRAVTSNKCPNIEHVLLMFRTVITSIDVPCLPCCLSLVITGCHTSIESYTSPNNDCDYSHPVPGTLLSGRELDCSLDIYWGTRDGFPIHQTDTRTANSSTLFHLSSLYIGWIIFWPDSV